MIVFLIVMVIVFIAWITLNIRFMLKRMHGILTNEKFNLKVKCEKCGTEYEVNVSELNKSRFSKTVSVTKTKLNGAVIDNSPRIKYAAKKFLCPVCNKRKFAAILNFEEYQQRYRPLFLKVGLTQMAIMVIGGYIIKTILSIVHKIIF